MNTSDNIPPLPTLQDAATLLARELVARLEGFPGQRYMLGITGGPGAGKSTFAGSLCNELNGLIGSARALVVPMDGFHKTNAELHASGMWERKGDPETFDARGFVNLLLRMLNHPDEVAMAPLFDRETDEPVPHALRIAPSHTFIIVEGNYLLLPTAPWHEIPEIMDDVWYLDAPEDAVVERLERRHLLRGLSKAEIERKIAQSDLRNARLIAEGKDLANRILSLPVTQE